MASRMSATEVVAMLGELFTEFDELCEGPLRPRRGHRTTRAVDAGGGDAKLRPARPRPLPAHRHPQRRCGRWGHRTTEVRIRLWGDTVNTASRLESHGDAGRIRISQETRERLPPAISVVRRGAVAVKGKGEMVTYWLTDHGAVPDP